MASGIDYSKWDKMAAEISSSENEEDDETFSSQPPTNVTKLSKPSSVTIGPQGVKIHETNSSTNPINQETKKQPTIKSKTVSLSSLIEQWTRNGGIHDFEYFWSQTADELVIRFLIPKSARAKNVQIGFDANNRHFNCTITTNDNQWILKKVFSRKLKESTEEEAKLDWELCDVDSFTVDNKTLQKTIKDVLDKTEKDLSMEYMDRLSKCRLLKVVLEKERINNRVIEWWDKVFQKDTTIDLKHRIKDRKTDANKMNDVWAKAHQQFKEQIRNSQPTEIDID